MAERKLHSEGKGRDLSPPRSPSRLFSSIWQAYEVIKRVNQSGSAEMPSNTFLVSAIVDYGGTIIQAILRTMRDEESYDTKQILSTELKELLRSSQNEQGASSPLPYLTLGLIAVFLAWWISLAQLVRRILL
ncbi:hypothetical protein FHETE_11355 [Fusarium heterosporum]|uniref:Uncharacterized protein n=1 Tax=Fusarium heterosporum TaxID=42747 RepID=A0A8H5WD55_FUSHE|nr:hypothetical protein FHETE_11355 [Fusarium heterosporum]